MEKLELEFDKSAFEALGISFEKKEKPKATEEEEEQPKDKFETVQSFARMSERHFERRVKSELALQETLPWHFENGYSYHCISHGDVDSLTYLRAIVKQQKIKYVLLSTWCMAITDVEEIKSWLDKGYIERIDFYCGEIFQKQYAGVYKFMKENCIVENARVCICRNHSKVMAGYGERFDFVIESSANVNTNPRIEQASIHIDTKLADFFKEFYDGLNSFNKDFPNFKVWEK